MQTQAQVLNVFRDETVVEGDTETLPVELDAIPGAVWQMELHGLLASGVRVTLFERSGRKCALLRFPVGQAEQAYRAFELALRGANQVSHDSHQSARAAARDASEPVNR